MTAGAPATGSLHAIKIESFTSDTAEFDQLLSSGGIDFGYVPFNDAAQVSRVKGTATPCPAGCLPLGTGAIAVFLRKV